MMESIEVDQAIFASSDRGPIRGYQLIAKSAGIDRTAAQALCRWSPTQFSAEGNAGGAANWAINFFRIGDDAVAITRTVPGGPEYSGRGGTQVVTLCLVLREEQFAAYSFNALAVAKTALAIGLLRLPPELPHRAMPSARLPSSPVWEPQALASEANDAPLDTLVDRLRELVLQSRRVAVARCPRPLEVLDSLLPRLPESVRGQFSFTTGLAPTAQRPFQSHFLPTIDACAERTLKAQNILCVDAEQVIRGVAVV